MRPSKSALTRSSILDAGHEFLETQPFRDLTVGKLMARSGQSRPTFYQYFDDVHGLMEALLNEVKDGVIEGAKVWLSHEGDPVSELKKSLASVVEVGHLHGNILRAVADAATNDARLEQVWNAFLGSFDEAVAARIAHDQASGVTPEFDPLPVAQALNRMDVGLLIMSFGTPQKAEKADVLKAINRVWLSTLYPTERDVAVHPNIGSENKT